MKRQCRSLLLNGAEFIYLYLFAVTENWLVQVEWLVRTISLSFSLKILTPNNRVVWWRVKLMLPIGSVNLFDALSKSLFIYWMGLPRPLFHLFSSFHRNITIFTANICEKCPSCIRWWYSNSGPSEHESPPITTRPGLPPNQYLFC